MFKKVLIAEDHGITGSGVANTLKNLSIPKYVTVHYCDDAMLKIKAALLQNEPFDLLITDLSFKEDHRNRKIQSGEELIAEVRTMQPNIRILVYSVEHRVGKIRKLLETDKVDAFVGKERQDFKEIANALTEITKGKVYTSPHLKQMLRNSDNLLELDSYDILTLKLLAKGLKQEEIAAYFQEKKFPASSLRSIQDRLGKLKTLLAAKTPSQLVAQAIHKGFI